MVREWDVGARKQYCVPQAYSHDALGAEGAEE